jgi:hypothetical protein
MVSAQSDEKDPSSEVSRPINRVGLASFLCGSLALLLASIPYLKYLAPPLSAGGLVLGALGIIACFRKGDGWLFAAAGLAMSLPVFCLVTFALFRHQTGGPSDHQQQLIPLRSQTNLSNPASLESDWVDASKDAVQRGDLRVRLVSAAIQPVELKEPSGKKHFSKKCLVIKLRISNAGAGRLLQYSGWTRTTAEEAAAKPLVYDPAGKTYAVKVFEPGHEVVGHVARASIPPGKWVDDVLVFEAVPPRVESLRLDLPLQALAMEGKVRFQIPGRMIASKASR